MAKKKPTKLNLVKKSSELISASQTPITHELFSIRDSKGNFFNIPFSKISTPVAERDFKNMTIDPQSPIFKNPEDYDLYKIASYDEKTGKVYPLDTPQHIAKAIQFSNQ